MGAEIKRVGWVVRSVLGVAASLAAGLGSAWAGTISGTATIRERIALPPEATFEARLLDASAPGGPELQMAVLRKPAGQSPIRFEIAFDSSQVQPGQRYIVRATVSVRGQVVYNVEPPAGVRLDDADPPLQLLLVAGGGSVGGAATPPAGAVGPAPMTTTALPAVLTALPARYLGNVETGNNTVRWTLDLQADGSWRLLTEGLKWFDRSRGDESGTWSWDTRQQRLVLSGGRESPRLFDVAGTGGLRVLDREGRPTAAGPGEQLLRQAAAPGSVLPTAPITPVGPAPRSQATSPLRGTTWKLLRLNGQAVVVADRQREPHLVIATETLQVSGSGGCNRFTGQVEGSGDRIAMKQIAATRMACAAGMQQESAFFDTLERAQRWRIAGSQLELLDNAGRVLARFEAVALR